MHLPVQLDIARDLPADGCSSAEAQAYTRALATGHYENFSVVTWLLPRRLQQHFYNVYAYCRWSDDLGDEVGSTSLALQLLDEWDAELRACYAGAPRHPVFIALAPTIAACNIPMQPFLDLLAAFRRDQVVTRHPDWDSVLDYCRYSANPVGRLLLYVCGYSDAERQRLSDATCTALQLANFWQDVARDLDKDRIYIPLDRLRAHGLSEEFLFARKFTPPYAELMKELIAYTRTLFAEGLPLAQTLAPELRTDIELFSRGGMAVLEAIERIGYNTLDNRPALSRSDKVRLLGRALLGRLFTPLFARENSHSPVAGRNA